LAKDRCDSASVVTKDTFMVSAVEDVGQSSQVFENPATPKKDSDTTDNLRKQHVLVVNWWGLMKCYFSVMLG